MIQTISYVILVNLIVTFWLGVFEVLWPYLCPPLFPVLLRFWEHEEAGDRTDAQAVGPGRSLLLLVDKVVEPLNNGEFDSEGRPRSDRPSSMNDDAVLAALERNPHRETVRPIFYYAGKVPKRPRIVIHDLTSEQRKMRANICGLDLARFHRTRLLNSLKFQDEKLLP